MKIVIGDNYLSDPFLNKLRSNFPEINFQAAYSEEEQMRHIRDADAFVGRVTTKDFLLADKLRWIHNPGTGIDWVPSVPELINSDVVLTNALGAHTEPMADHVFAMILTFAHRMYELREDQKAHRWNTSRYNGGMIDLNGQTIGILSMGGIGMAVARRATGFGMKVYGVDIKPMAPPPEVKEIWGIEHLDELIRISDWFIVTSPLTPETKGIIDNRRIRLLDQETYMIVISRGGIVDEASLTDALLAGHIAGVGLDVTEKEPLPDDSPLWDLDNVIISPHVSAESSKLLVGRQIIFKENLRRFMANEEFIYVCDKTAGF